jgi:Holliday junction resolvase RusA-like endonuclease
MIVLTLNKFLTHVKLSKNKSIKVNTQNIYNSKLHPHSRNKMVHTLHKEFMDIIPKKLKITDYPIAMFIEFHAPLNYDSVRNYKGEIGWKVLTDPENYTPKNDLDNMIFIRSKIIQDCLTDSKVIENDTIGFIKMLSYKHVCCDTLDDRKIVVKLVPVSNLVEILDVITKASILEPDDLEILNSLLNI